MDPEEPLVEGTETQVNSFPRRDVRHWVFMRDYERSNTSSRRGGRLLLRTRPSLHSHSLALSVHLRTLLFILGSMAQSLVQPAYCVCSDLVLISHSTI